MVVRLEHQRINVFELWCWRRLLNVPWTTRGRTSQSFFFFFLTLQYCIGFAIHQHESATGIHVFPILNPLPPPSGSSQCTSPEHLVSCIEPGLAIHFAYDIIHVSMPFSDSLFCFCLQSFPASGTFPVSWLFESDDQNTRASASASILPVNIQS